ncbi:MAG: NAD(P)H-quinone oxidoreductase subunit 4 [Pseudanabaenaceae cyanobacterium]
MDSLQFPWLTVILLFPGVAALGIPFIPDKDGKTVRWYALGVALLDFVLMVYAFSNHYNPSLDGLQLRETLDWLPQLHLRWSLAVDGLSMPLVLLTGLVNTLAIFATWQEQRKPKLLFFLLLLLYGAQIGVFTAQDLVLFFLMWEVELVPVYLLISIWGGARRQYAATKFILYTAIASIFIFLGGLGMAFSGDQLSFDFTDMALKNYSLGLELVVYAGLLLAFGVKLSMFPLHTWLPDAHGEASAPVSMILAGVMLKMGGYALLRFNVQMLADAHAYFAPVLAVLGAVNVIYGALTAFAQTNMKRRLAYSSISHMGFVLLGIASYSELGLSGAMLQMISHGLIAAMLFFLAGVIYDRTHTLQMAEMGGIGQTMPKAFALFTAGAMASLALPGMSGFVSELKVFLGVATSETYTDVFKMVMVLLTAVGLIATPIYLLSMLREVFYGSPALQWNRETYMGDAKPRELFIALCLIVPIVLVGVYPKLVTQTYDSTTVAIAAQARQALSGHPTAVVANNPR